MAAVGGRAYGNDSRKNAPFGLRGSNSPLRVQPASVAEVQVVTTCSSSSEISVNGINFEISSTRRVSMHPYRFEERTYENHLPGRTYCRCRHSKGFPPWTNLRS